MATLLTRGRLAHYALFGLPLGCIGLPLYVHLPKYYSESVPLSLASIGAILSLTRLIDCALDPFIGYVLDRYRQYQRIFSVIAVLVLSAGVLGLFLLPQAGLSSVVVPIALLLALTYLAYSVLTIGFYAAGVGLSTDPAQTPRISAWREGAVMLGVLVATALPSVLTLALPEPRIYPVFAAILVVLLAGVAWAALPRIMGGNNSSAHAPFALLRMQPMLRWVFALFFVNAIAPSITATLFLFFTEDVLGTPEMGGVFLLLYFLSALLAMPLWAKLSQRLGKRRTLIASMALALTAFAFAATLGQGDAFGFGAICILSGMALGGDLTVLPAILADTLGSGTKNEGFAFGIWNFISKFTLAAAAGIALPALAYFGYKQGAGAENVALVTFSYAVLPCIFKAAALILLCVSPVAKKG